MRKEKNLLLRLEHACIRTRAGTRTRTHTHTPHCSYPRTLPYLWVEACRQPLEVLAVAIAQLAVSSSLQASAGVRSGLQWHCGSSAPFECFTTSRSFELASKSWNSRLLSSRAEPWQAYCSVSAGVAVRRTLGMIENLDPVVCVQRLLLHNGRTNPDSHWSQVSAHLALQMCIAFQRRSVRTGTRSQRLLAQLARPAMRSGGGSAVGWRSGRKPR